MSLKEAMDAAFKFKIGDKVISSGYVEAMRTEFKVNGVHEGDKFYKTTPRINAPVPEIVVERLIQECHGGIQMFYCTRVWTNDGKQVLSKMSEMEIEHYDNAVLVLLEIKGPIEKVETEKSE